MFGSSARLVSALLVFVCIIFLTITSKSLSGSVIPWSSNVRTETHKSTSDVAGNGQYSNANGLKVYEKPPHRIVALIFAGRREFLSILNCYLQRNLARNGGWLDEVQWVMRTDQEADRAYIHNLADSTPEYIIAQVASSGREAYRNLYKDLRSDTIYVKIDDDVVFFEDNAISAIVSRLVDNPQYSLVSANVMNQPALAWVHYHLNVVLPFAPETEQPSSYQDPNTLENNIDWRPSTLPPWTGPEDFDISFPMINPAPFKHHRWLPLPAETDIEKTPVGELAKGSHQMYVANSTAFQSWTIAAQQHYSFLTHLENNELYRYKFDLWNYHYDRLSINFVAFWGKDIVGHDVTGSDEQYLTVTQPRRLRRPAVLDGSAMAVHFGFHRQVYGHGGIKGNALNDTDLVFRYKSFADEYICGKPLGTDRP